MIITSLLVAPLFAGLTFTPAPDGEGKKGGFALPVQLTAGGKNHTGIMYPSPVLHDVDGDGKSELLIGEIFGTITISDRESEGSATAWTKARPMQVDGKPIKLNNW